jgi:putative phosphoesterase
MLIGILADTHIPYRISAIPNAVLGAFKDVDIILHAGDVDESWALDPLEKIAPVYAVSGNYHIFDRSSGGKQYPTTQTLSLCGFKIVVTHGHRMGWTTPFWRFYIMTRNIFGKVDSPWRDRILSRTLLRRYPQADIIVFGHTHRYFHSFFEEKLVINPGSACATSYFNVMVESTVALLTLAQGDKPILERIDL